MENITFCKNSMILWYDIWKGTLTLYTVTAFHTGSRLFCCGTFGSLASKRLWTSCGNCGMEMTAGGLWQVGSELQYSRGTTLSLPFCNPFNAD